MSTNCTISIANFGKAHVRATRVSHGISIVSYAGEGKSRRSKALYSSKRTSGSFELDLVFGAHGWYQLVCNWLERYGRWVSDPKTHASACRVTIPSRGFDKTAVLAGGVTYGDEVGAVTYRIKLSFVGSRDPFDPAATPNLASQFVLGRTTASDKASLYFYPAGRQLQGSQQGWDLLYDRTNGDADAMEIIYLRGLRNPRRPSVG